MHSRNPGGTQLHKVPVTELIQYKNTSRHIAQSRQEKINEASVQGMLKGGKKLELRKLKKRFD